MDGEHFYIHPWEKSQNLVTERNFLNLVYGIYKNGTVKTIVNDEKLMFFPYSQEKAKNFHSYNFYALLYQRA